MKHILLKKNSRSIPRIIEQISKNKKKYKSFEATYEPVSFQNSKINSAKLLYYSKALRNKAHKWKTY